MTMTTRAAVLSEIGTAMEVRDLALEGPKGGEVLVRIAAAGVCHSDWHVAAGDTKHPLPVVLGHEGAGHVEAIGPSVTGVRVGEMVILNWAPSCGECFYCRLGKPNLCSAFVVPVWAGAQLDGTLRLSDDGQPVAQFCSLGCFSEYAVVPESCCVPIQGDLAPEVAALIGCAVTTGIGSVLNTAQVTPGAAVAVLGAGGVGLSTVMGAVLAGASEIVVLDPLERRRTAASLFGATHVASNPEELAATLKRVTSGRGADFVFEASGSVAAQERCLALVRPGGLVVFTGLSPMGSATNLPGAIIVREEKTVKGSYYGSSNPQVDFLTIVDHYRSGRLPLDKLVSQRYRLDQINEAFADMLTGSTLRGVVLFDQEL